MRASEKPKLVGPPVILDNDPTVSMDIDLGKRLKPGEVIDVDFNALRNVLNRTGAPYNNGDSSIFIKDSSNMQTGVNGSHNPKKKETLIKFSRSEHKMQTTLQHELRHYGDLTQNPLTKPEIAKTIAGNLANTAGVALMLPNAGFTASLIATDIPQTKASLVPSTISEATYEAMTNIIEQGQNISIVASLGAMAVSAAFYWANKREKTARNAEKLNLPYVITID